MTDSERIEHLAKQVCDYEDTLFRLAYPQKFCVGSCQCHDLNRAKIIAQEAFHRWNPKPEEKGGTELNG